MEVSEIIRDVRPGQAGVLLFMGNGDYYGWDEPKDVLGELRKTGVFTEVRESPPNTLYEGYDRSADPVPADWVLIAEDAHGQYLSGRPEIPFTPLFTFGLIPCVVRGEVTKPYRLVHLGDSQSAPRTFEIPIRGSEVIGLISAMVVSAHPDWHMIAVDTTIKERATEHIVKAVLRSVVDSIAR